MEKKTNLKTLLFIMIGVLFCIFPMNAKASTYCPPGETCDYEVSFKFYEYDSATYGADWDSGSPEGWLADYISVNESNHPKEITDLSTLSPGDIIVVSPILKTTTSNPTGISFGIYYFYDPDIFEFYEDWQQFDKRTTKSASNAIFPPSGRLEQWDLLKFSYKPGEVTITFNDKSNKGKQAAYNYTGDRGFAFAFLKVKAGADPSQAKFLFATGEDNDHKMSNPENPSAPFETMGSDEENIPVYIQTIDYIPEVKQSSDATLSSIKGVDGTDSYVDLSWTSGSTDTSFNGVVSPSVTNLTLTLTAHHAKASIAPYNPAAPAQANFALKAASLFNNGIQALAEGEGTATNTYVDNLTGLTTGDNVRYYEVTAEDGSKEQYTVTIKRLNDDTSLGSVTLSGGLTPTYNAANKTYSVTGVPYATASTDISASVTTNSNAKIVNTPAGSTSWTITNDAISNVTWNLTKHGASNPNTGTIKVEAENCDSTYQALNLPNNTCASETYTVSVTKDDPKTIATLKDLTVGGTTVTGFVPDDATKLEYTIANTTAEKLTIGGTVTDNSNATIESGTGDVNLTMGDNTLNVVVKAEDSTTKLTYKIKVKRVSNDATLKALTLTSTPSGKITLTTPTSFDKDTKTYTYTYDEDITSVSIKVDATNTNTMVSINGETATKGTSTVSNIDPKTTNTVTITTTAEDGTTTETYTINFTRKTSSVNVLKELHVTDSENHEYITSFAEATSTYNITVPTNVSSLNISATAKSDAAKINGGTNTYTSTMNDLSFDTTNTHTITVAPEDGSASKTITINVTRTKSNNANLASLTVNDNNIDLTTGTVSGNNVTFPDLNSDDVNTITTLPITYTTEDTNATVKVLPNANLTPGQNNTITVEVTAHNGTTKKNYILKVYKKNTEAKLKAIAATSTPAGKVTLTNPTSFNEETKTYTYTYDEDITSLTIKADTKDSKASVSVNGKTATTGTNTSDAIDPKTTSSITITTTAEDGLTTDTYTINFTRKTSSVNVLKELHVTDSDNHEYITSFAEATSTYNITVPTNVSSLNISAIAKSDAATINGGTNTYTATMNDLSFTTTNTHTITVAPEDGSASKTITINVTRTKSNNANLSSLTVNGTPIDLTTGTLSGNTVTFPDLNPDDVNELTSLPLTYVTEDPNASAPSPTTTLEYGKTNTITIVVTAQDGTTKKNYVLKVYKKDNDTKLKTLTVTDNKDASGTTGYLNPAFDTTANPPVTHTYYYDRSVTSITINGTSEKGSVLYDKAGGTYTIPTDTSAEVTVTAENGDTGVYTINFDQIKETNNNLSSLVVEGTTTNTKYVNETTNPTTPHSITLDQDDGKINISATLAGSYAKKISIDGEETLNPTGTITKEITVHGNTTNREIKIIVTAEDNSTKEYILIVSKPLNTNATLSKLEVQNPSDSSITYPLTPSFSDSVSSYTVTVEPDVTSVNLVAEAVGGATIGTGNTGVKTLSPGDNKFEIEVTAESGGSPNKYTVIVHQKYTSATIDKTSLTVTSNPTGTLTASDTDDKKFTYTVSDKATSVDITLDTLENAKVISPTSLSNISIASGDPISIVVESEDGSKQETYTIEIAKLSSNAYIDTLSLEGVKADSSTENITLDKTWDKIITSYSGSLNGDIETLNIDLTLEDADSTFTGKIVNSSGTSNISFNASNHASNIALSGGTNTITLEVTSKSSDKETYTIVLTKKSNNTDLGSLSVTSNAPSGVTERGLDPAFDSTNPGVDSFTYYYNEQTTSITVNATAGTGSKIVSGNDTYDVSAGSATIVVEAEDGTQKTYTINFTHETSSNSELANLTVKTSSNEYLNTNTPDATTPYEIEIEPTENSVTVELKTGSAYVQSVTIDGEVELSPGTNVISKDIAIPNDTSTTPKDITILIVGEDGTSTSTYTIKVTKKKVFLDNLTISEGTLTPTFAKETDTYTATVENEIENIRINATPETDANAIGMKGLNIANVDGTSDNALTVGDNIFTITVSKGTESKTYTLTVTRKPDSSVSLDDLKVSYELDGTVSTPTTITDFSAEKTSYTLTVPYGTTKVWLDATPASGTTDPSTMPIEYTLTGTNDTVTFDVLAEDGTTRQTYTITIETSANTDNKITDLNVFGEAATWNATENKFEIKVASGHLSVNTSDLTATLPAGASIKTGTAKDLGAGKTSYEFVVVAGNGDEETYTVEIERDGYDLTESDLTNITITDQTMTPTFNKDTDKYTLTVPNSVTSVEIKATKPHERAKVEIGKGTTLTKTDTYTLNLDVGANVATVKVTAENGDEKEYTITVTRESGTTPPTTNDKITSDIHTIDDDYVLTAKPGVEPNNFKKEFTNPESELFIYEEDGTTAVTSGNVGTGMIIKLERDGTVLDQKTIMILGDTNGDGAISARDALLISNHILNIYSLENAYYISADTNKDDAISARDALLISNHILNIFDLFE